MSRNYDIVLIGGDAWGQWPRRPELLARALAKRNRIFYVDPGPPLRKLLRRGFSVPKEVVNGVLYEAERNVFVYTCGFRWRRHRSYAGNWVSMRIEEHYIRRAMRHAGIRPQVIGYQAPYDSAFLHCSEFKLKFYDCIDEWSKFCGVNAPLVRRIEDEILANVDVVFTTAKALLADKSRLHSNCHYLPNALGEQFLLDLPEDSPLGVFDGLTLGYVGSLSGDHFDYDLIENLLKVQTLAGRPFRIALVGPIMDPLNEARSKELARDQRLVLTGIVPYEAVPAYLGSFDFCILPWRLTELVKHVDPIKIYEYLRSGAPIITKRWPEVEIYKDVLYFAETAADYAQAIETELRKAMAQRKAEGERRRELVRTQTWNARANTLLDVLDGI